MICVTPLGQEDGGTPPHTPGDQPSWAQSLQPRPPGHRPPPCPHSRAPEPSGGVQNLRRVSPKRGAEPRVRGCASGTCSDVSDVLRGSSRPAGWGRLPSHCVGVGGGQPLPAGGTCFLERESLLRDRGTQEPPLGLARVTEAKHSKPGPALERVRPAGRWGRPDLLTLGPGTGASGRVVSSMYGCFSGLLEAGGSFQVGHRASPALLEGGHRCVLVIKGPLCGVDASQCRLLGWFRVALRNQMKWQQMLVFLEAQRFCIMLNQTPRSHQFRRRLPAWPALCPAVR